jgi:hypothetical protein
VDGATAVRRKVKVVADPGLPADIATDLAERLPARLSRDVDPSRDWEVEIVTERIPADEQGMIRLPDLAPARMGHPDELVVYLTDQPRRAGVVPVVADALPAHHVALASLPALGAARLRSRADDAIVRLIAELVDEGRRDGTGTWALRRFERVDPDARDAPVRYVARGRLGRLLLLVGMVRANRPWRLVPSLSGAFAAALGTGGIVLINETMWRLALHLSTWRLAGAALLAICAMVAWLIVDHHMWESVTGDDRHLVPLYNAATIITLALGVVVLYAALFLLGLLVQWLLLESRVFHQMAGEPSNWVRRVKLTWLAASIATVGGALGTGFETDEAVRVAAYGYRQRERRRAQDALATDAEGPPVLPGSAS